MGNSAERVAEPSGTTPGRAGANVGTSIRIGFWGPLYCNDNKEPPT